MGALDRLLLEAKSLARLGIASAAARHCASVEAARSPTIEKALHGAAKARAAFALKLLMLAQEEFRNAGARGYLLAGIEDIANALRHEPDHPARAAAPADNYYWVDKEDAA